MAKSGETISEQIRAKMSLAHKARWAAKRDVYLQICNWSPHLGTKRSEKTRSKMSWAHVGKKHSPETIEKIRATLVAKKTSSTDSTDLQNACKVAPTPTQQTILEDQKRREETFRPNRL